MSANDVVKNLLLLLHATDIEIRELDEKIKKEPEGPNKKVNVRRYKRYRKDAQKSRKKVVKSLNEVKL